MEVFRLCKILKYSMNTDRYTCPPFRNMMLTSTLAFYSGVLLFHKNSSLYDMKVLFRLLTAHKKFWNEASPVIVVKESKGMPVEAVNRVKVLQETIKDSNNFLYPQIRCRWASELQEDRTNKSPSLS